MRDRHEGGGARSGAALLAVLALAAACSRGVIVEQDGEGGILSNGGVLRGSWNGRTQVGELWTKGGVTLCRTSPGVVARIVSIRPVQVEGAVRVVAIHVRTSLRPPADATVEDYNPLVHLVNGPGPAPPNAREPAGYLVPTACRGPRVGEIMVTMVKTGPEGGYVRGLEVTYRWEGRLHRFVIPWEFGLCGTATVEQCYSIFGGPSPTTSATPGST